MKEIYRQYAFENITIYSYSGKKMRETFQVWHLHVLYANAIIARGLKLRLFSVWLLVGLSLNMQHREKNEAYIKEEEKKSVLNRLFYYYL